LSSTEIDHTAELVQRCRKGNKPAQYRLYLAYVDTMFSVCKRLVPNPMDAEEILQDVFVKAYTQLNKLKDNRRFGGWLKAIAIHECLNFLKKKKTIFDDLPQSIPDPEEINETVIEISRELLMQAVDSLPEGSRVIFNLYLVENYKHTEIAQMLNISVSTSKSQYARAKHLLKEKLSKKDERQI
jgi:RNA polymerase sigma-70 factor (ECF subfamily)